MAILLDKIKKSKEERTNLYKNRQEMESKSICDDENKGQYQKIQYYQKQIVYLKKQLEGAYNIDKITALENDIKQKEKIQKQLSDEVKSLEKMEDDQNRALGQLNNVADYQQKKESITKELREYKEKLRNKQAELKAKEKEVLEQHSEVVGIEEKCRKLADLIKKKKAQMEKDKKENKADSEIPELTIDQQINSLKVDIGNLRTQKKALKDKLIKLKSEEESKIKDMELQIEILKKQIKQRENDCRVTSLKIKELNRQLRYLKLKPIEKKSHKEESDDEAIEQQLSEDRSIKHTPLNEMNIIQQAEGLVPQIKQEPSKESLNICLLYTSPSPRDS